MSKFNGRALLPSKFVFKSLVPFLFEDIHRMNLLRFPYRRYLKNHTPDGKLPVSQISLRVNELCNLRCESCGQWGDNGHLLVKEEKRKAKKAAGEEILPEDKLQELDLDTVKRIIVETRKDKPVYYIWGGEPSLWRPLVPFFRELGKHNLYGSIVSNGQNLEPLLEDIIETGALSILFLSLDGWDAESQNKMRSAKNGKSDNFEKVMSVIDKVDEIKKRKGLKAPFVVPITVISNNNVEHLAQIHELVKDKCQLHPYYYGWFITEERAAAHEKVFEQRFGFEPKNHKGYLKSCFNDVDPAICADQIEKIKKIAKTSSCVPQFLPDITSEEDIERYYSDHSWDAGYPECESIYHVAEISPNGTVTPCRDYQDYVAGNINEQAFYDIWHGAEFKKFRKEMEKGLMPVCTRCCGLQGF